MGKNPKKGSSRHSRPAVRLNNFRLDILLNFTISYIHSCKPILEVYLIKNIPNNDQIQNNQGDQINISPFRFDSMGTILRCWIAYLRCVSILFGTIYKITMR